MASPSAGSVLVLGGDSRLLGDGTERWSVLWLALLRIHDVVRKLMREDNLLKGSIAHGLGVNS